MADIQSNNKLIARNTIMLYIRMLFSVIVGLYTSRVVLQTLGVEDYGVYGIVGGIISMMGFINASMSGATSRFITYELGRGDLKRLSETFSSALLVHIFIAVLIVIIGETVGLWFLQNKLVIPEPRMHAAHWVYQLSIFSAAIGVTQAPYTACIMSHEKMDIYAYFELLNVGLKLVIVYLLILTDWDKLIVYAILVAFVSLFMQFIYRLYCIRHYNESSFHLVWNKGILLSLLSFSGWDLYGNMSYSIVQQGRNIIINMFFGVLLNAASSIATTVQGVLSGFSSNVIQAIRPQIIKSYSIGNIERMQYLIIQGAKFAFLLQLLIALPIVVNSHFVLELWLGEVPSYASSFCQIILISNAFSVFGTVLIIGIHATGQIKRFFYTGTISMLQLLVLYLVFTTLSINPNWTYYIAFVFSIVNTVVFALIAKKQVGNLDLMRMVWEWMKCIVVFLVSVVLVWFFVRCIPEGWMRFFITFFIFTSNLLVGGYFFLLGNAEKRFFRNKVFFSLKNVINRKNS